MTQRGEQKVVLITVTRKKPFYGEGEKKGTV